ncbi:hypothetical protein ACNQR7_26970 [Mycolicibacterium senegalense]|uniref:hypothetical protein n=1 Tax=Mycolicibacterium TaxID=1866885 RepID=UPI003204CAEF
MSRPSSPFGGPVQWVNDAGGAPVPGMDVFDTPAEELPPLTRALRQAWSVHTPHPVANSAAMAAMFAAVHDLEIRVAALES